MVVSLTGCKRGKDCALNLCRRDSGYRAGCCFPSPQQRRADVESVAHAILAGKARAHEIAAVVVELAQEQGTAFGSFFLPTVGLGGEQFLHSVEGRAIDD